MTEASHLDSCVCNCWRWHYYRNTEQS